MTHAPRIVFHEYDSLSVDALPLGPGVEYVRADVAEKERAVLAERVSTLEDAVRVIADEMTLADEGGEFSFYIEKLRAALAPSSPAAANMLDPDAQEAAEVALADAIDLIASPAAEAEPECKCSPDRPAFTGHEWDCPQRAASGVSDTREPAEEPWSHPCQRCGSETWEEVDYSGCSDCREAKVARAASPVPAVADTPEAGCTCISATATNPECPAHGGPGSRDTKETNDA